MDRIRDNWFFILYFSSSFGCIDQGTDAADTEEEKAMKVIPRKTVKCWYSSIGACGRGEKQTRSG
jgi:hypothetical protein